MRIWRGAAARGPGLGLAPGLDLGPLPGQGPSPASGQSKSQDQVLRIAASLAGAAIMLQAGACVSVTRTLPDGTQERLRGDQIRDYAGEVFRRHNAVGSALLQLLPAVEATDLEAADVLLDAEEVMNESCAPIDALAVAYRDGEPVDLGDKVAFARALGDCEASTARLEGMLAHYGL